MPGWYWFIPYDKNTHAKFILEYYGDDCFRDIDGLTDFDFFVGTHKIYGPISEIEG
jgi:hypothetical protein